MGLTRSELRVKAMVILYQVDIYKQSKMDYNVEEIIKANVEVESEFIKTIVYGVIEKYEELNELANKYLDAWNISRLDKTGASILRMAIYELKYMDTPQIVVINEAIELAKKYSDEPVRKMINAVLDKIIKEDYDG